LDQVLDELAEAAVKGQWQPNEVSEERRLALLPSATARDWESLVRSADYMRALDLLP
jgi:beta-N-acetylhexosaminidase